MSITAKNEGGNWFYGSFAACYKELNPESMDGENWKGISGYYGRYMVSNLGRIKSLLCNGKNIEQIRILNITNKGYLKISLFNNGYINELVHRIVAKTFIPNPHNKPEVNHKDGNKKNNYIDNLEWATSQENANHKVKNNFQARGENGGRAILRETEVLQILFIYKSNLCTQTELGILFGVSRNTITNIIGKRIWKHLSNQTII